MVEKKSMNFSWVAVGALAAVVVAVVAVFQTLDPPVPPIPLINPSTLTAKIESYPYRHAATTIFGKRDLWREEWVQPLEQNLEELNLAPNVRETVVTAMERLIQEKYDLALERYKFGDIQRARKIGMT